MSTAPGTAQVSWSAIWASWLITAVRVVVLTSGRFKKLGVPEQTISYLKQKGFEEVVPRPKRGSGCTMIMRGLALRLACCFMQPAVGKK